MMNYQKSEFCRPWQNAVYTLLVLSQHQEVEERDGYDKQGWAPHSSQPIIDESRCRARGHIPASPSPEHTIFIAGGRLTLARPPFHFAGEEIAFMLYPEHLAQNLACNLARTLAHNRHSINIFCIRLLINEDEA